MRTTTSKYNNNKSHAALEKRARELAVMDWSNIPYQEIRQHFGSDAVTFAQWRAMPCYQQTLEQLRDAWLTEISKLPTTQELKKKINQAMTLGVEALIRILAGKYGAKDKISAARLAAQLDGRFLGVEDSPGKLNPQTETLADALLTEIKKTRETVQ